jgi:hypothetical protein
MASPRRKPSSKKILTHHKFYWKTGECETQGNSYVYMSYIGFVCSRLDSESYKQARSIPDLTVLQVRGKATRSNRGALRQPNLLSQGFPTFRNLGPHSSFLTQSRADGLLSILNYSLFNPEKPSGNKMSYPINNSSFCIYGFHMIFNVNMDYFLKHR